MTNRTPIVGGNWKMNTDRARARSLMVEVTDLVPAPLGDVIEVIVFPPLCYLRDVAEFLPGRSVGLGAQNFWPERNGAYTGEVSAEMLRDCGCTWVLAGHSERRHVIGEDDALVNRKVRAGLDAGLRVVLCVGETKDEREADRVDEVNLGQLETGLAEVDATAMERVVIAYEPVWAIGTGLTATPDDAQAVHAALRGRLADLYDDEVAAATRIQYGGSVKPDNAAALFAKPDIDGGLIGGASLDASDFASICRSAAETRSE